MTIKTPEFMTRPNWVVLLPQDDPRKMDLIGMRGIIRNGQSFKYDPVDKKSIHDNNGILVDQRGNRFIYDHVDTEEIQRQFREMELSKDDIQKVKDMPQKSFITKKEGKIQTAKRMFRNNLLQAGLNPDSFKVRFATYFIGYPCIIFGLIINKFKRKSK